jgi:hypothetical protein
MITTVIAGPSGARNPESIATELVRLATGVLLSENRAYGCRLSLAALARPE